MSARVAARAAVVAAVVAGAAAVAATCSWPRCPPRTPPCTRRSLTPGASLGTSQRGRLATASARDTAGYLPWPCLRLGITEPRDHDRCHENTTRKLEKRSRFTLWAQRSCAPIQLFIIWNTMNRSPTSTSLTQPTSAAGSPESCSARSFSALMDFSRRRQALPSTFSGPQLGRAYSGGNVIVASVPSHLTVLFCISMCVQLRCRPRRSASCTRSRTAQTTRQAHCRGRVHPSRTKSRW